MKQTTPKSPEDDFTVLLKTGSECFSWFGWSSWPQKTMKTRQRDRVLYSALIVSCNALDNKTHPLFSTSCSKIIIKIFPSPPSTSVISLPQPLLTPQHHCFFLLHTYQDCQLMLCCIRPSYGTVFHYEFLFFCFPYSPWRARWQKDSEGQILRWWAETSRPIKIGEVTEFR